MNSNLIAKKSFNGVNKLIEFKCNCPFSVYEENSDSDNKVTALQTGPDWDKAALQCLQNHAYPSTPASALQFQDESKGGPTWTGVLRSKAIFSNKRDTNGTCFR